VGEFEEHAESLSQVKLTEYLEHLDCKGSQNYALTKTESVIFLFFINRKRVISVTTAYTTYTQQHIELVLP